MSENKLGSPGGRVWWLADRWAGSISRYQTCLWRTCAGGVSTEEWCKKRKQAWFLGSIFLSWWTFKLIYVIYELCLFCLCVFILMGSFPIPNSPPFKFKNIHKCPSVGVEWIRIFNSVSPKNKYLHSIFLVVLFCWFSILRSLSLPHKIWFAPQNSRTF